MPSGRLARLATALIATLSFTESRCDYGARPRAPQRVAPYRGAPAVWVVDDGHRIASDAAMAPPARGDGAGVWAPGERVELFGLPGETLALQVVVSAGAARLDRVTVDLASLTGPSALRSRTREHAGEITSFVVRELELERPSEGRISGESLGWTEDATPELPRHKSLLPEPLVPAHVGDEAPPLALPPGTQRAVWLDVALPRVLFRGRYEGTIVVREGAAKRELARVPLSLEVGPTPLPFRALRTMLFFDPSTVMKRVGTEAAIARTHQELHRHHVQAIFPVDSARDVRVHRAAIDGRLFLPRYGYDGPGQGVPADVVAIGAYGSLGDPSPKSIDTVRQILRELDGLGGARRDVFLYAIDEQCSSDRGRRWRAALRGSSDARLRSLPVGHTCSLAPSRQGVDLVMMHAGQFTRGTLEESRRAGKSLWVYNGSLPHTGAFLSDAPFLSLRANAWIQAHAGIERWFYWNATYWDDDNRGGKGPYDPLRVAETFHNDEGDHCNGDGVLLYPGRQWGEFVELGIDGVVPSMRLKQWRRGIQDAGYLALANRVAPARARAISERLVGSAFSSRSHPSWPLAGAPWVRARRELFDLIAAAKR